MFHAFLRDLQQPEYIHVLINPLPVYGLAIGLAGLIIALLLRSRRAQVTALVLILVAAASAWPVAHYGEEASDRVQAMTDDDGGALLEAHQHRADQLIFLFYVLAVVALGAIVAPFKWPKSTLPLTIATLLLALTSLGAGSYIAYAGGKIRHREFRNERPPPRKPVTDENS